jgi:CheY-like chemotaxis protein
MGGIISVMSKEGEGSEFKVLIPLAVPDLAEETIEEEPQDISIVEETKQPRQSEKPFVLLVEDEGINQMLVKRIISDICNLEIVESGEKAIEACKKRTFQLILMDINLGKSMTGVVATGMIRKSPKYAKTPIVALTAFAMRGDREEFLRRGLTHYISKPFDTKELLQLVTTLLGLG